MSQLVFENHNINPDVPTISISKCLELVSEAQEFDADAVAQKTYNKHFNNPESQYYQKTVEEIKDMWAQKGATSRQIGKLVDDYIGIRLTGTSDDLELYKLDYDIEGDPRLNNNCCSFDKFMSDLDKDMEFITREQTIYIPLYDADNNLIAYAKGRFDALFRHKKTGKYIIIDWKTTETIKTNNIYAKLVGPFRHLDDCELNKYTLQGYFYKLGLPQYIEGISYDDIEFRIVQFPGRTAEDDIKYNIVKPGIMWDENVMRNFINWSWKKKQLLDKKNG